METSQLSWILVQDDVVVLRFLNKNMSPVKQLKSQLITLILLLTLQTT